jgi:hypothetical protein
MSRHSVNVTKGKQGFQPTEKSEPAVAELSAAASSQDQWLLDRRDEWLDNLKVLSEESMRLDEALIAERVLAEHPKRNRLRSLRISVEPADGGDSRFVVKPYNYTHNNSNSDVSTSQTKVWEGDADEALLTEAANVLTERNRQTIWDTGRGPIGGPGYKTIDLRKTSDLDGTDNLAERRTEVAIALTEAENEVHQVDAALAARSLQNLGIRETRYTVTSNSATQDYTIKVRDVRVSETSDLDYVTAQEKAREVLEANLSPTTLKTISDHQLGASASVLDRFDTYYAGEGDE